MNKTNKKTLVLAPLMALTIGFTTNLIAPSGATWAAEASGTAGTSEASESVYNSAIESIKDYNKVSALRAALAAVQEQIPEVMPFWDMSFGVKEITGNTCGPMDLRGAFGIGCGNTIYHGFAIRLAIVQGIMDEPEDPATAEIPEAYSGKTLQELITIAKGSSAYTSDSEFKKLTDEVTEMYDRGVASLRENLAVVDPSLTDLDTKTGDELVAIYENLPEVKDEIYSRLVSRYDEAYPLLRYIDRIGKEEAAIQGWSGEDGASGTDHLSMLYGALVAAATEIDPSFKVDLSGVARLSAKESKTIPTAPNTGDSELEELSATVATIAIASIACIAASAGIVLTAKRYFFSPLKRRK